MPYKDRKAYNSHMRAYLKVRYKARRADAIARLGGVCVTCGTQENLQFDHTDPKTKENDVSVIWNSPKFWTELEKCQILCATCHLAKTTENDETTNNLGVSKYPTRHGNYKGYNLDGCRCVLCHEWKKLTRIKPL